MIRCIVEPIAWRMAISCRRVAPREIHGVVVYQTIEEDHRLSLIEYSSVAVFVFGLGLGLVYLEKWGRAQARYGDEDGELLEFRG